MGNCCSGKSEAPKGSSPAPAKNPGTAGNGQHACTIIIPKKRDQPPPITPNTVPDAEFQSCCEDMAFSSSKFHNRVFVMVADDDDLGEVAPPAWFPSNLSASFAFNCSPKPIVVANTWSFLRNNTQHVDHLSKGGILFAFTCAPGSSLGEAERSIAGTFINLSGFQDEVAENNVPHIDMENKEHLEEYNFMVNKAQYILPSAHSSMFTPHLLSDPTYHKAVQPSNVKVIAVDGDPDGFRITKPIIPLIFTLTIQFHVSVLPSCLHTKLRELCDGMAVHKAILMERTKRDKTKVDSTRKAKSILLYNDLPSGGLLVTNVTVVVNTSIPKIAAKVVDTFGGKGSEEVADCAKKTRQYVNDNKDSLRPSASLPQF